MEEEMLPLVLGGKPDFYVLLVRRDFLYAFQHTVAVIYKFIFVVFSIKGFPNKIFFYGCQICGLTCNCMQVYQLSQPFETCWFKYAPTQCLKYGYWIFRTIS